MKNALKILDSKDLEVKSKIYQNDMIMIHSSDIIFKLESFSLESIFNKIQSIIDNQKFLTINDFSKVLEINTIFAKILVEVY